MILLVSRLSVFLTNLQHSPSPRYCYKELLKQLCCKPNHVKQKPRQVSRGIVINTTTKQHSLYRRLLPLWPALFKPGL